MMGMMGRGLYNYGGNWDDMPDYMQKMMQNYYGNNQLLWTVSPILSFAVQILLIVLLIAVIRWVWRKGSK